MSYFSFTLLLISIFSLSLLSSIAKATVPLSDTFKFVNEGEFGPFIVEYGASYRVLSLANSPFQLAFYNTTPNAFTLALRMGTTRSESSFRWVWEANRGNPVEENATLTFGTNGNLVLANADGSVVWQTNTADKGVVGLKLLSNGNIVLHDAIGKFIWQSFDSPTDTFLVGQSFRAGSITKLVSRVSEKVNAIGPYSFVLESKRLAFYYKSPNSPKPILYFSSPIWASFRDPLKNVTFSSSPQSSENFAFELTLDFSTSGSLLLARPNYNSTLTYLRLGVDGDLKVFTFYDKVDSSAWEMTFSLFSRDSVWANECELPERCGRFGVCEENQCVACPSQDGLFGWSNKCESKKLASCGVKSKYYKIEGVDHFMSKYNKGDGPVTEVVCGEKCTKDCKCLGYFYHQETSRCWIAYELKTLQKVSNSKHLAFIKVAADQWGSQDLVLMGSSLLSKNKITDNIIF